MGILTNSQQLRYSWLVDELVVNYCDFSQGNFFKFLVENPLKIGTIHANPNAMADVLEKRVLH